MNPRTNSASNSTATDALSALALVGFVLVAALGPAVADAPTGAETTSAVSGTFLAPDGDPLVDDAVWVFDSDAYRRTRTDESGSFALADDGTIGFYQRVDGHHWERDGVADMHSVSQVSESNGTVTVPTGHVLNVRVLDADGDPVPGANVSIRDRADSNASVGVLGETDADGFYRADGAPFTGLELAGNASVVVRPPPTEERFVQRSYRRDLAVTNETTLTVRLEEGRKTVDASGELTAPDGTPASGTVRIRTERTFAPTENRSFALNDSGGFEATLPFDDRFEGLTFHHLTFSQDGFPRDGTPDLFAVDRFEATESRRFVARLPAAHAANVTVRDDDGTPVPNASVVVVHRSPTGATTGEATSATFRTDSAGRLVAGGTPGLELAGRVTIRVLPPDSNRFTGGEIRTLVVDEPTEVTISLDEAPAIRAASDRWFVDGSEAALNYDVENADGAAAEYAVDGGGWRPASRPVTVSGLAPGDHSVAFRLVNGSGPLPHESASDAATVTVDVEPPELTVEVGREDVRPGTPLRAIVSDTAISDVFYRTNRSESGSLAVSETLDERRSFYEIDPARWPAVPTELVVTARDRAGNVRTERVVFDFAGAGGKGREVGADAGGGGGGDGGQSRPVVQVTPGDDGVAVDLLNGRDGATAWADLGGASASGVRFSAFGVTFDRNDANAAITLSARTPPSDSPADALAALRVEKRYVRTGDVASATLRFSLGTDALPSGASPSDLALYQRRDGGWRRLAVSREGRNFSATVYDLSTVVVGVERGGADSAASGAGNASTGERGEDDGGTDDRETIETSVGPATVTDRPATTTEGATPRPETEGVRSDGQPGFGFLAALVALIHLVRKRQRI